MNNNKIMYCCYCNNKNVVFDYSTQEFKCPRCGDTSVSEYTNQERLNMIVEKLNELLEINLPTRLYVYRNYSGDFIEIEIRNNVTETIQLCDACGLNWKYLENFCEDIGIDYCF